MLLIGRMSLHHSPFFTEKNQNLLNKNQKKQV